MIKNIKPGIFEEKIRKIRIIQIHFGRENNKRLKIYIINYVKVFKLEDFKNIREYPEKIRKLEQFSEN